MKYLHTASLLLALYCCNLNLISQTPGDGLVHLGMFLRYQNWQTLNLADPGDQLLMLEAPPHSIVPSHYGGKIRRGGTLTATTIAINPIYTNNIPLSVKPMALADYGFLTISPLSNNSWPVPLPFQAGNETYIFSDPEFLIWPTSISENWEQLPEFDCPNLASIATPGQYYVWKFETTIPNSPFLSGHFFGTQAYLLDRLTYTLTCSDEIVFEIN
jgi:hypothetical protein